MVKTCAKGSAPADRLCKLPAFRPVAVRLLSMLDCEDVSVTKVTHLLKSDPAFSAEVLTLANSALYARLSRIDTVERAVIVLGMERTRALASTVALHGVVSGVRGNVAQDCWRHSRAVSIAASCLGPFYGVHPEQAYTAGLMHDIGRLGMLSAYPEYSALMAVAIGDNQELLNTEQLTFSVNHCQAGLLLTRIWGLPEEFGIVASEHHTPITGAAGEKIELVRMACLFAQALGFKAASNITCDPVEHLANRIPNSIVPRSRFSLSDLTERLKVELQGDGLA